MVPDRARRASARQKDGDPGEIRTHDLQIRNLLLYPAELRDRRGRLISKNASDEEVKTIWLRLMAGLCVLTGCGGDAPLPGMEAGERARVVRINDGDTLVLDGGQRVRLAGLEAPALPGREFAGARYAEASRDALAGLILGRDVQLFYPGPTRDRYGRAIAHVVSDDERGRPVWLNVELLRRGAAWVRLYPDTDAKADDLLAAEAEAREDRRGLWALEAYQPRPAAGLGAAPSGFVLVDLTLGPDLPLDPDARDRPACRRAVAGARLTLSIDPAAQAICDRPAGEAYEVRGRVRGDVLYLSHRRHAMPRGPD